MGGYLRNKIGRQASRNDQTGQPIQPQTDAWTPNEFLEPQTPLLLPHPRLTALVLDSLAPGAEVDGLDAEEVDRSLAEIGLLALSLGANPYPKGEGNGVVDRLFRAGLEAWLVGTC